MSFPHRGLSRAVLVALVVVAAACGKEPKVFLDASIDAGVHIDADVPDDRDMDAVADTADTCPDIPNADQANLDLDALGDVCDGDDDGDNRADVGDNCPRNANSDQLDTDNDGRGDACDDDDDN